MNRRNFLGAAAASAAAVLSRQTSSLAQTSQTPRTIQFSVDRSKPLGTIRSDFMGLGYEISSVATGGPLSGGSPVYEQLVRTLGPDGVIRIGGNTSDYARFSPSGQSVLAAKGSVINEANLKGLGAFLDATGWKLIWGLNLGSGAPEDAVAEAQAVTEVAGNKLIAFEIGNEPDLFVHEGHRKGSYTYDDYLSEYRRYKQAIRRSLPHAPFAGPDVAGKTDWVKRFATDEGRDLKLLTCHYYREGQNPTSTLAKLLQPDPGLLARLQELKSADESAGLPYRICETNSFSGGGRPGVSDTFGAALWVMDFMFTLACAGSAGVNIETGINQLDRISSYSPLRGDASSGYSVGPDYYGMLAFAQAAPGKLVAIDYDASGLDVTAYAVEKDRGTLAVSIINKEPSLEFRAHIRLDSHASHAGASWLRAPRLESTDGITLSGSAIKADGTWKPATLETVKVRTGECELPVPPATAVVLIFETEG
jgi:hypothetical protein